MLLEKLQDENKKRTPMHMPGHKRNLLLSSKADYLTKLAADCDITEIDGFDDLHDADGILKQSMEQASFLWGCKATHFLVNGSTCGILSGIYAAIQPGDTILVSRNCHKSVYHAIELFSLNAIYLLPEIDPLTRTYASVSSDTVEKYLSIYPDVKLVLITSPTYEGFISDIESISKITHRKNIPLMVDEAHGSHLGFGYGFEKNAIQMGADIIVHSLHKTLASLTQTAAIHLNSNRVSKERLQNAISIFETSSPSYLLLSSIDGCVNLLLEEKETLFSNWRKQLEYFKERMKNLKNLVILEQELNKSPSIRYDDSKIVVSCKKIDLIGTELMKILREKYFIELEMASLDYVVAMTGIGDTEDSMKRFADALIDIDQNYDRKMHQEQETLTWSLPKKKMNISNAMFSRSKFISFEKLTKEHISSEYIWAYPPGIPLIVPGEYFDDDLIANMIRYQENGISLRSSTNRFPNEICILELLKNDGV